MHCPYCRSVNGDADERCLRCGRRLRSAHPRRVPELLVRSNAAAVVEPSPAAAAEGAGRVPEPAGTNYQPSLFRDSGAPKVVPIPMLTPLRPVERRPARRANPRPPAPRAPRRSSSAQQALDLQAAAGQIHAHPDERIYCAAPVATPGHRLLAAAVDGGLVLAGAGVVILGPLLLYGDEIAFTRAALLALAGVLALVAVLYRALWAVASSDTPGMLLAGLRLVDFDGRRPRGEQRLVRQLAGLLSLVSAGLGLAWALVDEESLTWHDHISKTFPTAG